MQGRGVEKNIDKGLELMTLAAEKYSLEAQVNLANFYRTPGKYQDLDKSIHWFGLAAGGGIVVMLKLNLVNIIYQLKSMI